MAYSRPGVYISERLLPAPLPTGVSANAAGAIVAPFAQGPEAVTLVTSWYEFVKYFGGYNVIYPATFGVSTFFQNGGRELYVKRILASNAVAASVDLVTSGAAVVATITAKNKGSDGNNLRITSETGTVANTYTITVYKEGLTGTASVVTDDVLLERYENVVFDDSTSTDFAETVVNLVSSYILISNSAAGTPVANVYPLSGGSNGSTVASTDYTSYQSTGASVFNEFSSLDRPLVVFLPDLWKSLASGETAVYDAATSWAAANNSFVVIETAENLTVSQAISASAAFADTSYAAVYYPHIYIADPLGRGAGSLRKIGPSASVAGLFLNTDANQGVFKAPAGIRTSVQGAVAMERSFTSSELDSMNASTTPVNPIRQIPGGGLSVMGARTLLQDGTANKYVNMRRSLIFITKNLKNLTQFAIFENNDERLWAQIRSRIGTFLEQYRGQGGLRGATSDQAYFIKCDAENNTAAQIANGEVHIQVGVALQYPAEFIVIDLSQKTVN
jgi:uncharacterized protein